MKLLWIHPRRLQIKNPNPKEKHTKILYEMAKNTGSSQASPSHFRSLPSQVAEGWTHQRQVRSQTRIFLGRFGMLLVVGDSPRNGFLLLVISCLVVLYLLFIRLLVIVVFLMIVVWFDRCRWRNVVVQASGIRTASFQVHWRRAVTKKRSIRIASMSRV